MPFSKKQVEFLRGDLVYSVYVHTNKVNGKRYVGITKQKPDRRWQKGYGYIDNPYFFRAIQKYGWDGFDHEVLSSGLSKKEACETEIALIAKFETTNRAKGYNISRGGETGVITIKRGKDNPRAKAINVFDSEHKFLFRYDTQTEAANKLGLSRKCITKCCLGQLRSHGGYVFEYADFDYEKIAKKMGRPPETAYKKVRCIDTGVLYASITEAAKETGANRHHISNVCRGKRKTAGGLSWKYA